jgi:hypothetical protein
VRKIIQFEKVKWEASQEFFIDFTTLKNPSPKLQQTKTSYSNLIFKIKNVNLSLRNNVKNILKT